MLSKKTFSTSLTVLASAVLIGSTGVASANEYPNGELFVSNWAEYMAEDTISNFEQEFGIKVSFTPYDSVEAIDSKLLAGNSGYDVVVHAASQAARLHRAGGILQKVDKTQVPNLKHMSPDIMAKLGSKWDPGHQYIMPYTWGTHGVTFNRELVLETYPDAPIGNIEMIFKPEHMAELAKCGVAFMDSQTDMIPMALAYLGYPPDSTDRAHYKEVEDMFMKVRPYIKTFDNYAYQRMPEKEFCVAVTWGPDGLYAMAGAEESAAEIIAAGGEAAEVVELEFFVPEIANFWIDAWVIPADAKNVENAHKFINYTMRPQVSANDTNFHWYATANQDALPLIDEAVTSSPAAYPTPAQIANMYTLNPLPPRQERVRTRTWTNFMTGTGN